MATLAVQEVTRGGLEAVFSGAAGGGDQFLNDGRTIIEVANGDVSDKTVTIVTQSTKDGLAVADRAVVVTASERRHIGPFPPSIYNDINGYVQLTYSAVTSVTIAALRVP